jgi:acyl-CoA thioester hydrolase
MTANETAPAAEGGTPAALAGYQFITQYEVDWADQDALNHVNHKVFLGWMESNRVAYFGRLGLWAGDPNGGLGIILAAISCNYRQPVSYPDRVYIGFSVVKLGTRSIGMHQAVFSQKANVIAADSESTVVVYDYRLGQSCAIPESVRKLLTSVTNG